MAGGGDENLVHTLLEWANKEEPGLLALSDDLPTASSASRLSLDDLKKEVKMPSHTQIVMPKVLMIQCAQMMVVVASAAVRMTIACFFRYNFSRFFFSCPDLLFQKECRYGRIRCATACSMYITEYDCGSGSTGW